MDAHHSSGLQLQHHRRYAWCVRIDYDHDGDWR